MDLDIREGEAQRALTKHLTGEYILSEDELVEYLPAAGWMGEDMLQRGLVKLSPENLNKAWHGIGVWFMNFRII